MPEKKEIRSPVFWKIKNWPKFSLFGSLPTLNLLFLPKKNSNREKGEQSSNRLKLCINSKQMSMSKRIPLRSCSKYSPNWASFPFCLVLAESSADPATSQSKHTCLQRAICLTGRAHRSLYPHPVEDPHCVSLQTDAGGRPKTSPWKDLLDIRSPSLQPQQVELSNSF